MPDTIQTATIPHVSVCICTYKRLELLSRLLGGLRTQETQGRFTYSVVIVDNDAAESARAVAEEFGSSSGIETVYCVEPKQNIALARNKAVASARGEFVLFVDDDEFTVDTWISTLVNACDRYNADGALGPVKPHFDVTPPKWIVDGRFYDRPTYPTGTVIDGPKGRTGNTLIKRAVFGADEQPFRPEFLTGEDQDFFRRMIEKGHKFIWCDEAVAWEVVPPVRWSRGFMLRRALLRGANSLLHPSCDAKDIAKSAVAVPLYALASPFALFLGQGRFMLCVVKMFDHLGKLFALVGYKPVKQAYVTE